MINSKDIHIETTEISDDYNASPVIYASYYQILRRVAIKHGYALAIHGTLARDMDLIAVPWASNVASPRVLIEDMRVAIGGFTIKQDDPKEGDKPHGRMAYVIHDLDHRYLDISVFPNQNSSTEFITPG